MHLTDTIVIGGGQAGLAASHHLAAHDHHHVVLERGRLGQRWRSGVWDSLRMLSPNWLNNLPGRGFHGADRDGYASAAEFAANLAGYAASFGAPVERGRCEGPAARPGGRFEVTTPVGSWRAANVVIATGWCDLPLVPDLARDLDAGMHQVTPNAYRNPASMPAGGVLVVGASATGVQLAPELSAAGARSPLRSGATAGCPGSTEAETSSGGCCASACSTPPSKRSATRPRHVRAVVPRGRPTRSAPPWTWPACSPMGYASSDACPRPTATGSACPATYQDLSLTPTGVSTGSLPLSTRTSTPPGTGATTLRHRHSPGWPRRAQSRRLTCGWPASAPSCGRPATAAHTPGSMFPFLDERGEIRQRHGVTPIPGMYVLGHRFQHYRTSNWVSRRRPRRRPCHRPHPHQTTGRSPRV